MQANSHNRNKINKSLEKAKSLKSDLILSGELQVLRSDGDGPANKRDFEEAKLGLYAGVVWFLSNFLLLQTNITKQQLSVFCSSCFSFLASQLSSLYTWMLPARLEGSVEA